MIARGQIREGNEDGRVAVVSETPLCGRFMVSPAPGELTGPLEPADIEQRWPRVVDETDDPGLFKLLAHLETFFTRMGIPAQARRHRTVLERVGGFFGLVLPGAGASHLPLAATEVEREAMATLHGDLSGGDFSVEVYFGLRDGLREIFGLVEPSAPEWAQPGCYVFDIVLGRAGEHVKVLAVSDGQVVIEAFPSGAPRTIPAGAFYHTNFRITPQRMDQPQGLPCEACGRRQRFDGCSWAPCLRCKPYLYDAVSYNDRVEAHLWWCRLTLEKLGCTCEKHRGKVPFWNATREGMNAEVAERFAAIEAADVAAAPNHQRCDVTWPVVCPHTATERRSAPEFDSPMRYCGGHAALFDAQRLADEAASAASSA